MLDESLCGMYDAEQAISRGTCDLFNIRLSKCGGFLPSLRLVQLGHDRRGLATSWDARSVRQPSSSAAGRHFASSVPDLRLRGRLLRSPPGARGSRNKRSDIRLRRQRHTLRLTGSGLNIEIDAAATGAGHGAVGAGGVIWRAGSRKRPSDRTTTDRRLSRGADATRLACSLEEPCNLLRSILAQSPPSPPLMATAFSTATILPSRLVAVW